MPYSLAAKIRSADVASVSTPKFLPRVRFSRCTRTPCCGRATGPDFLLPPLRSGRTGPRDAPFLAPPGPALPRGLPAAAEWRNRPRAVGVARHRRLAGALGGSHAGGARPIRKVETPRVETRFPALTVATLRASPTRIRFRPPRTRKGHPAGPLRRRTAGRAPCRSAAPARSRGGRLWRRDRPGIAPDRCAMHDARARPQRGAARGCAPQARHGSAAAPGYCKHVMSPGTMLSPRCRASSLTMR